MLFRSDHESMQAKKGTRKKGVLYKNVIDEDDAEDEKTNHPNHRKNINSELMKRFQDILQQDDEERALCSGAARSLRWTGTNPGYTASKTGNSANAASRASTNAKKVSEQRHI